MLSVACLSAFLVLQEVPPSTGSEVEDGAESALEAHVLATVNGQEVAVAEYGRWLLDHQGWAYMDRFLELVALRQEADVQGVVVTSEDLAAALDQDWNDNVLMRFSGDEALFVAELERAGLGREGWRQRRLQTLETDVLAERLAVKAREPTEEQLRATFAQEFGADSTRKHLRVAFFDRRKGGDEALLSRDRLNTIAMDRARAFLATVVARPAEFAALVKSDSDLCLMPRWDSYVRDLREQAGELPRYRDEHFDGVLRQSLAEALATKLDADGRDAAASPGEFLEPILTSKGVYVVQVVAWQQVEFEAVREEMSQYFRTRLPTAQELYFYKKGLLERAKLTKNPGFRSH